ncbi:unnamed protein product [Xylocopa violacea]|uniref:Uncharacterized protein n=1 Tax=Xylocopa violacea TaxID=135666 RepID=A0ABP1NS61_XYLVO
MQMNETICKVKPTISECNKRYRNATKPQRCSEKAAPRIPMFLMIPIEEKEVETPKNEQPCNNLCATDICDNGSKPMKFPEMRCGILFTRCHCVHRDGLQDACPLTQCQTEECLVKPWPVCLPARYLQSRHPEQYPPCK